MRREQKQEGRHVGLPQRSAVRRLRSFSRSRVRPDEEGTERPSSVRIPHLSSEAEFVPMRREQKQEGRHVGLPQRSAVRRLRSFSRSRVRPDEEGTERPSSVRIPHLSSEAEFVPMRREQKQEGRHVGLPQRSAVRRLRSFSRSRVRPDEGG